jgi:hypothetical protein
LFCGSLIYKRYNQTKLYTIPYFDVVGSGYGEFDYETEFKKTIKYPYKGAVWEVEY